MMLPEVGSITARDALDAVDAARARLASAPDRADELAEVRAKLEEVDELGAMGPADLRALALREEWSVERFQAAEERRSRASFERGLLAKREQRILAIGAHQAEQLALADRAAATLAATETVLGLFDALEKHRERLEHTAEVLARCEARARRTLDVPRLAHEILATLSPESLAEARAAAERVADAARGEVAMYVLAGQSEIARRLAS